MSRSQFPTPDEHVIERPFTSPRRILITLAVLSGIAAGLYTAWWFWLAGEVREQLDAWVAAMRLDGRTAAYSRLDISGFPGKLDIDIRDIAAAEPDGGWRIRVPGLKVALAPWAIEHLDGSFTGPIELTQTKGAHAGQFILSSEENKFSASTEQGGSLRADLVGLRAVTKGDEAALTIGGVTLTLIRGSLPVYGRGTIEARNIDLPPDLHSAFGGKVERFKITADATGAELPEGITPDALERWSGDGGAVDIRSLEVAHGVLGLNGEGTLALDGDLQPIGAFTAKISGFNEAVDVLVASGAARRQDGALAKAVLGVLASSPSGGGPKVVSLPLTLQDRQLSVGPIKLLRLRRVKWE